MVAIHTKDMACSSVTACRYSRTHSANSLRNSRTVALSALPSAAMSSSSSTAPPATASHAVTAAVHMDIDANGPNARVARTKGSAICCSS